jgi:type VI protein secretion system component VasF
MSALHAFEIGVFLGVAVVVAAVVAAIYYRHKIKSKAQSVLAELP